MKVHSQFPVLTARQYKGILQKPEVIVGAWWHNGGRQTVLKQVDEHSLVCDGWIALLAFLPRKELAKLQSDAHEQGVKVHFVATTRDIEDTVRSELQHWVVHDLGHKAELGGQERVALEQMLRTRASEHTRRIASFEDEQIGGIVVLPLYDVAKWPELLSCAGIGAQQSEWRRAMKKAGIQNSNPPLPLEGILLTLRVGEGMSAENSIQAVLRLLDSVEKDPLCKYLIVLGIDSDEAHSPEIVRLKKCIESRSRVTRFDMIVNEERSNGSPFPICRAWHQMAERAWNQGADWVVLLGDDVELHTPNHYQELYRAFLSIADRLGCPFGFGCPWWKDRTFPGFPTFPVVGKEHFRIFQGLVPKHRIGLFINQDLDPYLQRLYLAYGAAPAVEAELSNLSGGNIIGSAGPVRYERVQASGWRDWVLDDAMPIGSYLLKNASEQLEIIVLDVLVPTYRIDLRYLERICSLSVPDTCRTTFIIVVDNPKKLIANFVGPTIEEAAQALEQQLVVASKSEANQYRGNNIRVRSNTMNIGASASRNRGLDESAAEFVLFLDDDVRPEPDLLARYEDEIKKLSPDEEGLVGLVRFPRASDLPLKHAAVLMSYLTFMFEIASNPDYSQPAWGVTANIIFRRRRIRFDTDYAKTGGGEDVDFCLRQTHKAGAHLKACPSATVHHDFWPGSPLVLSSHFFNWAIGDSALFCRFPAHTYRSWPNATETLLFLIPAHVMLGACPATILSTLAWVLVSDVVVDMARVQEYRHRCSILEYERSTMFCVGAHVLANVFVIILESGRLWGHMKRGELQNITKRFDWHCGRLENSEKNFRHLELTKFVLFVAVAIGSLVKW